jgi:hypothetical protein
MTSAPSTDKVVLFPPPVESVAVSHSGAASCCHNLDDPSCDCDDNDMTSVNSTSKSMQSSPAMSKFWESYDGYDWSNLTSSNEKLATAITFFVAASKDIINFPDCHDVRRLLVPLFVTKASEANNDPRSIARTVIETYGLKNSDVDISSSASSASIIAEAKKTNKDRPAPPKKEKGKGAKLRNFTKEEDLFLSRAYVRVSLDPIRGNDQKSQDFWAGSIEANKVLVLV